MNERLSEEQVADAFHSYLKSSLSQAKAERLLDTEMLSSAEADLMITGPALCLYFAALRSTTSPPSVPLPRSSKTAPQMDLSQSNCPPAFISFLHVWSLNVHPIQSLAPEHQHDLARIVCGLDPIAQPLNPSLNRIAAELRAVAIEISQRRTFQDRYAADLQAAIDAGEGGLHGHGSEDSERPGRRRVVASFVPPPMYDPTPTASPNRSPNSAHMSLPSTSEAPTSPRQSAYLQPPMSPSATTSSFASSNPPSPRQSAFLQPPMSPENSSSGGSRSRTPSPASSSRSGAGPPSPTFAVEAPAIQLIRETLYASLGDVIGTHPYIRRLLRKDPPRAYFASVALAILDVALSRTSCTLSTSSTAATTASGMSSPRASLDGIPDNEEVVVTGVLGAHLTLRQCPPPLRPFMRELGAIGAVVRETEEEDNARAIQALQDGAMDLPTPRMERVRRILERGVGSEHRRRTSSSSSEDDDPLPPESDNDMDSRGRLSVQGRAISLANRINALALGMSKLKPFRERQNEIFKILANVVS